MASIPTTLKMPADLKDRIAAVVDGTGKTPHAFMLEAIEEQTKSAEKRKAFIAEGEAALDETQKTGKAYRLEDVHEYMQAKMAGKKPGKIRAKNWPR
jgi:predicted transcriptional regulator